jgi:predicted phage terminase large subunit-like protein
MEQLFPNLYLSTDAAGATYRLKEFISQAWRYVEPGYDFVPGWHIDAICEHLEAVSNGDIKRLMINIPPRHMKSLAVSVFWPAWEWANDPLVRFLYASYSESLSKRDSLKCRRLIQSSWYQKNWGHIYQLAGDQSEKLRFENDRTGYRIATSVGGLATGEGGDRLVIDDPHKADETLSDTKRENVITWWDQVMSTRLNDPKLSAIVIIMQRLHEGDLTGHILAKNEDYDHLCLPAEYEGRNRSNTSLGFEDPRSKEKELLWPARYGEKEIAGLKKALGSYGAAGQLQQNPTPREGSIVQLEWFKRFKMLPPEQDWEEIIQVWDTAQKADELTNAPWVCGTWLRTKQLYYLIHVYREWKNYPAGKRAVKNLAEKFRPNMILIEDKSTGSSLIQELPLETGRPLPITGILPEKDKVTRLSNESPIIEAGYVALPDNANWLHDYENELGHFPNSEFMDQADMTSMALHYFRLGTGKVARARWM